MKHLVYYISAHGYGHGVRSCDMIRELLRQGEGRLKLTLVTMLPEDFLRNRLPDGADITIRTEAFDVGMVQLDSIQVDVPATLHKVETLLVRRPTLLQQEMEFLRSSHASGIVADIPAIPLEAAAACSIPAIAVGNFSWDWIYSPFIQQNPAWEPVVASFYQAYQSADLLLKLPFAPDMKPFRRQISIPLLATPGTEHRAQIATQTGADPHKPWVLLSFTSLQWDSAALQQVEKETQYEFFTVKPLEWPHRRHLHAIDREKIGFSDLLASVDVVITKPGFGILSECIANQKPMIYADRADFIEYPLLVDAARQYLRCTHIPAAELYAGRLSDALRQIQTAPKPTSTLPGHGAELAAREILRLLFDRATG